MNRPTLFCNRPPQSRASQSRPPLSRLALLALLALASCGAGGPPTSPDGGITMSGSARMGINTTY